MKDLIISKKMTDKEEKYIRKQLRSYNLKIAPPNQEYINKSVSLVLKDKNNSVYGGLIGTIYRACLFIDILWVTENKRGLGYGKELLIEGEQIAKDEACTFIHLDTFSFQAPDFYQGNGYEIYGVLDLYSDGVKRFYLKKEL